MNFRKNVTTLVCTLGVLLPMSLRAQQGAQQQPMQPPAPGAPMGLRQPPMERAFGPRGVRGRWWDNPEIAQRIGLTDEQRKKMDDVFQQQRLKLIDLDAALKKEEVSMEPLVNSDQPDEAKLLAQIDRVAQARAELEKANARMLFGIRRVLTVDQWKTLQEMHHARFHEGGGPSSGWERRGGPGGPDFVGPHGME